MLNMETHSRVLCTNPKCKQTLGHKSREKWGTVTIDNRRGECIEQMHPTRGTVVRCLSCGHTRSYSYGGGANIEFDYSAADDIQAAFVARRRS